MLHLGSDGITIEAREMERMCRIKGGKPMKKISRIIAGLMLAAAVVFFWYAGNHPEAGFPWSNTVTYVLYGVYALVMIVLFVAPFKRKSE